MKKQNSKLVLLKEVLSELTIKQMSKIKGGEGTTTTQTTGPESDLPSQFA